MTTADLRMKRAFDEMARSAHSPSNFTLPYSQPSSAYPDTNITPYELPALITPSDWHASPAVPATPSLTLHRYRQSQTSPTPSPLSDLDFKRVRRKRSHAHLLRPSFDEPPPPPTPNTSSPPSARLTSPRNFSLPFSAPSPQTPANPTSATTSPSLSSSVDTLQSSPSSTPLPHDHSIFDSITAGAEEPRLSEPLRTKRKFPLFKPAKRLPHHTQRNPGGFYQVHAVIVELDAVPSDSHHREDLEQQGTEATHAHRVAGFGQRESALRQPERSASGSKGRSVRFEGITASSSIVEFHQQQKASRTPGAANSSLSSSFAPEKYRFPAPLGPVTRRDRSEHSPEQASPVSPATLYFNGASFDLVNPHQSLMLGSSQIETPAEIDGLLDDYFHSSNDASMSPYDDITGEMSASQQDLPSTSSRQRILYDDPYSARRTIMGIRDSVRRPRNLTELPPSRALTSDYDAEDVGMTAYESDAAAASSSGQMVSTLREDEDQDSNDTAESRAAGDRASSIYPQSQRSEPFPLTVDDLRNNQALDIANGRGSFYAGNEVYYGPDEDFTSHEDGADADADANADASLEPETTVTNIVQHYKYSLPEQPSPVAAVAPAAVDAPSDGAQESLPSSWTDPSEWFRGYVGGDDALQRSPHSTSSNKTRQILDTSSYASGTGSSRTFDFEWPFQRNSKRRGPPSVPAPTPPLLPDRFEHYSDGTEGPITDQTYGNTTQLLQLTPQTHAQAASVCTNTSSNPGPSGRGLQPLSNRDAQESPFASANDGKPVNDQDWEDVPLNTAEATTRLPFGFTSSQPMQRSSSYYPEDDVVSTWESTQASESEVDLRTYHDICRPSLHDRPSEDSYANTSKCSTKHRFSLPGPIAAIVPSSKSLYNLFSRGATDKERYVDLQRAFPPEETVADKGQQDAKAIYEDKNPANAILGKLSSAVLKSNQRQHAVGLGDLGELRQKAQCTPRNPVKTVTGKFDKFMNPSPLSAVYNPQHSLSKAAQIGCNRYAHQSACSEAVGLLNPDGQPYTNPGLQFSETAGTFQTTPPGQYWPCKQYSPLTPTPTIPQRTVTIHRRPSIESSYATIVGPSSEDESTEEIELQRLHRKRPNHGSRAAISGQKELQPLSLVPDTTPARSRRLTDRQLIDAEPGWTASPDYTGTGALSRHIPSMHGASFGIRQADGSIERVRLLMHPDGARNLAKIRKQKALTRPYYIACNLCPFTALLFACGGLDWRMRQMTKGWVTEMSPEAKERTISTYLILSVLVWLILGVAVSMAVVAKH